MDMKHLYLSLIVLFATSIFAQPTSFESRGVGGGGALFANSFNPFDPNELYIACDMSEVFHTTDLGASWTFPDFRQLQSYKIAKVSYTNNGNTLYAIDGSNTPDGSERSRPMRSTDKGVTWTPITDPTGGSAYQIFACPTNTQIIVLSDYSAIYSSTDGGATFNQKYKTSNNSAGLHVAGVFFDDNNIYIGTNEGIYSSLNGGSSFSKMNVTGIPASEYILSFSGAKVNTSIRFFCMTSGSVWAGIDPVGNYSDYKGVYTFVTGGSWQKVSGSLPSGIYPYFCGMATTNTNTAYIAGASDASTPIIYKTTDAGSTWTSVFKSTNNQNITTGWSGDGGDRGWSYGEYPMGFDVAPSDPNYVSFSDFGFVHISTDGGATWKQKYVKASDENPSGAKTPIQKTYHSIGLENTTCWQVTWIDKDNMYGCFSDIKGVRSTDAGSSWGFNYTGHNDNSMYYLTKNVSDNTLYAATSSVHDMYQSTYLADSRIDNGKGKVLFSNDNGASWQTLHDFQHPVIWLATDSQNPNRLYASVIHSTQGGIFVSNNIQSGASSTWTKLTNPPRTEGHPFNIRVLNDGSLLCSYSGRRTTNFTASSGVFLSTDGGATWQDRSDAGMQYWTKDVVIDPHDATQNTWYAGVFSGWGGAANNKGGLYKTTNRGTSWTRVHNEMRVTSATFSPSNPDVMYFTSETNGLYYSGNRRSASPTFTQVASYGFRQPERVFYNPYDSTEVWVSSFGHGMKVGHLGSTPTPKPATAILLLPTNHSTDVSIPVQLVWKKAKDASSYKVALSTSSDFPSASVFEFTTSDTTVPSTSLTTLTDGTKYYWRVQSVNNTETASWSEVWDFTTTAPKVLPDSVTLVFPPDHSMPTVKVDELPPYGLHLQWNKVVGATKYIVEIATDSLMNAMVLRDSTSDTSKFFEADRDSTYWWRVRAVNENGVGPWSSHWMFSKVVYLDVPSQPSINGLTLLTSPNPASGTVTLTIDNSNDFSQGVLIISDVTGKIVYSLSLNLVKGKNNYYWDTDSHPNGLYLYRLISGNNTISGQIVVKK